MGEREGQKGRPEEGEIVIASQDQGGRPAGWMQRSTTWSVCESEGKELERVQERREERERGLSEEVGELERHIYSVRRTHMTEPTRSKQSVPRSRSTIDHGRLFILQQQQKIFHHNARCKFLLQVRYVQSHLPPMTLARLAHIQKYIHVREEKETEKHTDTMEEKENER
jgi:hypothetical protein